MGVTASQAQNDIIDPNTKLATQWAAMKVKMFIGKTDKADSVDPVTLNHYDWYAATDFKRPYPGEVKVRPPGEFVERLTHPNYDIDD